MKVFKNINSLWDYCLVCHACKKNRNIEVELGPDIYVYLHKWKKIRNKLIVEFSYRNNSFNDLNFKWTINCNTNKSSITQKNDDGLKLDFNSICDEPLYIYINSSCNCGRSQLSTLDLSFKDNCIVNPTQIGIERESIYLNSSDKKYYLSVEYLEQKASIHRVNSTANDVITSMSKPAITKIINFDLSNLEKTFNQIENILLFN